MKSEEKCWNAGMLGLGSRGLRAWSMEHGEEMRNEELGMMNGEEGCWDWGVEG
jgi:hypothetical protein